MIPNIERSVREIDEPDTRATTIQKGLQSSTSSVQEHVGHSCIIKRISDASKVTNIFQDSWNAIGQFAARMRSLNQENMILDLDGYHIWLEQRFGMLKRIPALQFSNIRVPDQFKVVRSNFTLPSEWERRVNDSGRVYYVDHNIQSTTWKHPVR